MNSRILSPILFAILFICFSQFGKAQTKGSYKAIYSGTPWFDDRGKEVSAHGANIIKHKDRYYLFGEAHSDTSNAFVGFNCYSSTDLCNWKFESIALPLQASGKLGPNRVGERPKVMRCPKTGEYILYMHADTIDYRDQFVGYATSKSITGPYTFRGPLLFNGNPIKKWDMGTFQDKDGSGYVLLHGGDIYKLSDDYKSIVEHVNKAMVKGFESPAMFRKDSIYYFLGSDLTGWERNDNYYYTATSLKGPWTNRGNFAPKGTLTYNSQTTFVLPIANKKGTTFMFMGDRWSFPRQATAATYVWQPLKVKGTSISIPSYYEAWKILKKGAVPVPKSWKGVIRSTDKQITYSGNWKPDGADSLTNQRSDEKGASFSLKFTGEQIAVYSVARKNGGYARIIILDSEGKEILSANADMYSKYASSSLKFISPLLPKGSYTLTVSVLGEHWYWKNKKGDLSGSDGNFVSVEKVVFR